MNESPAYQQAPNGEGEERQKEVIALLADPATHGGSAVEHIPTHISHVFIAGPNTYKLKRAAARSFADYSTAEKRKAMCERELAINLENAPQIYKAVLPIVRTPDGLRLGGEGEAIDYVVAMRTFKASDMFDALADDGRLTERHIQDLADAIARQHKRVPRAQEFGGSKAIQQTIEDLVEVIRTTAQGPNLTRPLEDWKEAALAQLKRHTPQIDARRRHGYVRRCHGDLHLANICLFDDKPVLFDAIEFSEEIASIDILYDTAFTAMDLLYRGLRQHATLLISRYLSHTRDYSGLKLLGLFLSMRSAVRAMVAAAKDGETGMREATNRLEFALSCLAPQPAPRLLAIGGLSGTGKSTLAKSLAPDIPGLIGALSIRSDVCRKRLFGIAPEEPLPKEAYQSDVSLKVYATMLKDARRALIAGTSVIVDATFLGETEATQLEHLANATGAHFTGIWLTADLEILKARIAQRTGDASDATPQIAERQWQTATANTTWAKLDASGTPDEVAAKARQMLARQNG